VSLFSQVSRVDGAIQMPVKTAFNSPNLITPPGKPSLTLLRNKKLEQA
jgi:hypothetical protein